MSSFTRKEEPKGPLLTGPTGQRISAKGSESRNEESDIQDDHDPGAITDKLNDLGLYLIVFVTYPFAGWLNDRTSRVLPPAPTASSGNRYTESQYSSVSPLAGPHSQCSAHSNWPIPVLVCLPSLVPDNLWPWWDAILAFPGPGILVAVRGFRWILCVSAFLVVAYFIPVHCIDEVAFFRNGVGSMLLDFLVLCLQFPMAWRVNTTRQKCILTGIFLLGTSVCIVSILRSNQSSRSIRISHVDGESSITGFVPSSSRQPYKRRSSKKPLRVLAQ
ncbi:uncharacterized protein N7525_009054 [Penicillium rubens]|uniref:uncharacterized protein n=1 Tax=Penicillium rubens TaxID=1108849 RepID=UPI002A5ACE26|nr:uncharacterized protein N7525_009054 [Penicillium rubens]KAJ5830801.1 hypothetical protein N7525_009054 [Penicillium rubens]